MAFEVEPTGYEKTLLLNYRVHGRVCEMRSLSRRDFLAGIGRSFISMRQ